MRLGHVSYLDLNLISWHHKGPDDSGPVKQNTPAAGGALVNGGNVLGHSDSGKNTGANVCYLWDKIKSVQSFRFQDYLRMDKNKKLPLQSK